jgi:hypothetical protein
MGHANFDACPERFCDDPTRLRRDNQGDTDPMRPVDGLIGSKLGCWRSRCGPWLQIAPMLNQEAQEMSYNG